ncbi:polyprenyl synthetase family protein [Phocicoccus pinnipedialis]|uniref:Heptaprenyl diphosphate synthase component 2 n=2 Tax=Bacteria TaxID=2 RepID=A0A6V7REW6_9BACL|nr:polyprenyl synthetase family protein [Jeotgalicoccus pinnipedialis]MBP1939366.1 heptaprenyl diphosphate synthase [Jeotgalicoccus pinnipedialis]CAD2075664.1 Heptaprenyl diphosphate synthase component 2 [Jeotgalicoccus pinnipedialis]
MNKSIRAFVKTDLKEVEALIKLALQPNKSIVSNESFDLYITGGKKLRPILSILVGKLGQPEYRSSILHTAASLELIHMASLVHDDIIDDSNLRRNRKTTYYKHGYFQAINTGNYLISSAIRLVSDIHDPKFHKTYSTMIKKIVTGELFQFDTQFDDTQTIEDYYEKIYKKTALLIMLSIELSAYAAHISDVTRKNLTEFGYNIGMSFQIIDDCLDYTASKKTLGKPSFSDLSNGHYTLPVLLLRDTDSEFKEMLKTYSREQSGKDELIKYLLDSKAIEASKRVSNEFLDNALVNIIEIDEPIKQYLIEMVEKLRTRLN